MLCYHLKLKKRSVLRRPDESSDFKHAEMLWGHLKQLLHARKGTNITELKMAGEEVEAEIPADVQEW